MPYLFLIFASTQMCSYYLISAKASVGVQHGLIAQTGDSHARFKAVCNSVFAALQSLKPLRLARERRLTAGLIDACERAMPELLDVLALGLAAGLSFDASLSLYCERSDSRLAFELSQTMSMWQIGLCSRLEALEALSCRIDSVGVKRFCHSVCEALSFGAPLALTLEHQADLMRSEQRSRIEERIEQVPVRMLLPLGMLVVPAMLLAILGPLLCASLT